MKTWVRLLTSAVILLVTSTLVFANDPAKEFSITKNPKGVWSYGYTSTLGGSFNLYSATLVNIEGVQWDLWYSPVPNSCSDQYAERGSVGRKIPQVVGTRIVPRESLEMHPSCTNDYAVVRWTAPVTGEYELHGNFFGMQEACGGTSTDVHIRWNSGSSLFDGGIYGLASGRFAFFDFDQAATTGDTIDFAVGFGSDGDYACDSTALQMTIDLVPSINIKPADSTNAISLSKPGDIPVAILSDNNFDATTLVDRSSLTFGRIGDEQTLVFLPDAQDPRLRVPVCKVADVNGDGFNDLICTFERKPAGFQLTDTYGVLRGRTVSGITIKGTDTVHIVK